MRPKIKICGLTRAEDARLARELGADFFGMVLYAKSPRFVKEEVVASLLAVIPRGKRVAVSVSPPPGILKKRRALGFDIFQIHYDPAEVGEKTLKTWAAEVGQENIWLAPRQPPGEDFHPAALDHANTMLLDTFQKGTFGGTGRTGDWVHFKTLRENHSKHKWVLSGGLRPENIRAALQVTGAQVVDVNSGVESAPGVKDAVMLDLLFANLAVK